MSTNAAETVAAAAPDTVETVTDALNDATLAPKAEISEADAAHAASAAEGRRLYIGNLAYATTEEQLKEFFEGFSIESTSIPTNPRTTLAVGYAFVDVTTKEEAERAIAELSGKEVLERKVSVQLARKPGTSRSTKKEGENGAPAEGQQQAPHEGGRKPRGNPRNRGWRGRGRAGLKNRQNRENGTISEEEKSAPTNVPGQVLPLTEVPPHSDAPETSEGAATGAPAAEGEGNATGVYRPKKKRGPPENGVPSSTKVMVANLPYELTEDKLKELFAPYDPESAKIALRPIPRFMVRKLLARGEPRKGRGFGFVTLASEEMQKKAVEEMNGKVVDGREIAVKVAIDNPKVEGEDGEQAERDKKEEAGETNGINSEQPEAQAINAI
ncbi:hypothetical protein L873DRAFT_1663750 [Choiromyces venosus 120613-1]|uniref:RRM domain-containing protein n=1 Tax=Choiromyces venosus 120613-1 TaxID=1336337 RepID=A0A3N4K3Q8_9PEZI|nr:hypothetical protein L873DRAFT_1663750 [Choiromyces venosus 120613-1]